MSELIEIEQESALVAFVEPNGLDPFIDAVRKIVAEFEHDLSTGAGRKKTASLAAKVSSFKVSMDDMGKSLTEDWKNKSKVVDQARKKMRDELDALRDEARYPLTEWEDKEKTRVATIKTKIEYIRNGSTEDPCCGSEVAAIEWRLKYLLDYIVDDSFEEFKLEAIETRGASIDLLKSNLAKAKLAESQRIELERLRAESEARAKADREEALRCEGEQRAQREAETKLRAELEKMEAQNQFAIKEAERKELEARRLAESNAKSMRDSEERDRMAEETAKKNAIAAEKKLSDDEAKRKADMEHSRNLKTQAKLALIEQGLEEKQAIKIILAICEGKIPNISMRF
jgi:hypothetical protein